MFEQPTNSMNQSFRHQQSEQLSHVLEPCETPIRKPRPIRSAGGRVTTVANGSKSGSQHLASSKTRGSSLTEDPSVSTAKLNGNHELGLYLNEALNSPLLTKQQEQHLARRIARYRRAFERLILKEPAVIEYLVDLFSRWQSKQLRIDAFCNLGLSELEKRRTLEPKIVLNLKTLRRLPKKINSASSAAEARRLHHTSICLVEELSLRPQTFQSAPFENVKAQELLTKYRRLCQDMASSNLRLVVRVARQICGNSPVLLDMIQEGNRGLLHAITKFDYRCNVRFSTYATPWIKQTIFASLANSQRNIRVPENFRAVNRKIQRHVNETNDRRFEFRETDSGRAILLIANDLNMQPMEVERHLRIQRDTSSLDQTAGASDFDNESHSKLGDSLTDPRQTDPGRIAQNNEREQLVRSILKQSLTRRERDVISLRFGFKDGQDRSFAEVGRVMGLSRQRVCQVEKQALQKLSKSTQRLDLSIV